MIRRTLESANRIDSGHVIAILIVSLGFVSKMTHDTDQSKPIGTINQNEEEETAAT